VLARCTSEDRSAQVALQCTKPMERANGTDDVLVFVTPAGADEPQSRVPYALVRGDGLIRMGMADRRGGLFEFGAPKGILRLAVPAQLAR
jgi:cellulose synthase operon protein C